MPSPVKVLITFDDGSTIEQSLDGITSIFVDEAAAKRCNRNPPYKNGPKKNNNNNTEEAGTTMVMAAAGGQCYYVNGMIFCP